MKRRAFTLLELLIVLAILGALAAILFPVFSRTHCGSRRSSCQSNLKQIGLGLLQYAQDYDGRLPPTALNSVPHNMAPFAKPYGWADGIQPYVRSTALLHCPLVGDSSPPAGETTRAGFTDYWLNTDAAGHTSKYFDAPGRTFLCGEGIDGDARYNRAALPSMWLTSDESPTQRHLDGANFLFVDGHIKFIAAASFSDGRRAGDFKFQP